VKLPHPRLSRNNIPVGIKAVALLLAVAVMYYQDLIIIANEALRSELMTHVLAMPFLLGYILYRKRKILSATISFESLNPKRKGIQTHLIIGALLSLLAFLLYWYGSYTFYPLEYHMLSLPLFTAGLILVIFNLQTLRALAFPIAFLLFLTPPPSELATIAAATVSSLSAEISYSIFKAVGLPITLTTDYGAPALIVTDPSGASVPFVIGAASSGIYSLIGFSIFAAFLAYIARGKALKKTALFIAGLPLVYALNIIRIIILVSIGMWLGAETAFETFHIFGGWTLIFLGTLILLALSGKIFKIQVLTPKTNLRPCSHTQISNPQPNFCLACGKLLKLATLKISRKDLYKILVLATCVSLISFIQVPVFALTQVPPETITYTPAGLQASTQILPTVQGYELRYVSRDTQFERLAKADAALIYAYVPNNKSDIIVYTGLAIGNTQSKIHNPEGSLINWPIHLGRAPRVTTLDLREIQLLENPPIKGRYFAFQYTKTNLTQVMLYWYENPIFQTNSTWEQKYVQITLTGFANSTTEYKLIEDALLPFARAIVDYWQPIKTWSWLALALSQNATTLMVIPIVLIVIITVIHFINTRRNKRLNTKTLNKIASQHEKLIIETIRQTTKKQNLTLNAIAASYEKKTGKPIELGQLHQKLQEAEQAGLVERAIISREDEPYLIWRSQVSIQKSRSPLKHRLAAILRRTRKM